MAAPVTVDEFLELVRKSGVVEEKRLEAFLQKLRAAGPLPTEPAKLAGFLVRDGVLTHFQAEQINQGKWRRFTIGKYKVLERLGSGGMGSVFLCEHKLMRRRVAVKVLPTAKAEDDAALERFYREARAVAALDHPNIVHAYDIDQEDKLHFLVMEYVDGASLQEIVKKTGPLDVIRACHYIHQATLGLQEAHQKGLVHRDIKPGNILVDRTGVVKLLDMGLARFFNDEDDILTKKYDESVLGTADYLAPEQAIDSHTVDIRADIYGLGATFYYLLAGRPPFGEGTVAQKLLWHQTRNPRPITEYRTDVPPALVAVLGKMMAKDPQNRYASPAELLDALAPFTQTPIGPPAAAEMPQLSPAATGSTEVPDTATLRAGSTTAPPRSLQGMGSTATPKVQRPGSSSGGTARAPGSSVVPGRTPRPPTAAPGSSRSISRPESKPAAPRPAPPPPPAPVTEEVSPWAQVSEDTEDPTAALDTTPVRSGKRLARAKAEVREQRRLKIVLAAVGIPFLIVIAGLVWWFFPRTAPVAPATRPTLVVSRDAGKPYTYRTISQALRQAQAGDVIELHDQRHEENLTVEVGPGKSPANITLQAAPGLEVVWGPAHKDELEPILKLRRAAGFQLKGEGITLDGQDRVRDLISINLQCPGALIEGLTLKGFKRSAIAIVNGAGEANRPIRLHQLTVHGVAKGKPALYLDANPSVETVPFDDYIELTDLNVPGFDVAKAVQKKDNTVTGSHLVLP
jgi:serine/threonine protein kinase